MQGVFITGTDTGVGKTFVGTTIARTLNQRNVKVIPRKPIESGCLNQDGKLIPQDALALKEAANYQGSLSDVCPYRFEPPISPVRAAHLAGKVLTTEQLVSICLQGSEEGFLLVEGAGGFYSPLAENGLNADLAVALQLPVLLVADDKLGVLNQVLLNAEAIQTRGLQLAGVVLNAREKNQDELMDNVADLRERLDCAVFANPYCKDDLNELPKALTEMLISFSDIGNSPVSSAVR
ncbi:Dethiobiotin synthetase [hydrothermal vent metagenome]|uniref:Dethiobiotin synthetase n=1 Tax=hydrothermal vent metagenome TaxID=652676 RepID=A0A3B0X336_9ZZZZ